MTAGNSLLSTTPRVDARSGEEELFLILHDRIPSGSQPDQQDVLVEADNLLRSLQTSGRRSETCEVTSDFPEFRDEMLELRPSVVVNLVETVDNSVALAHVPLLVLDILGIPYTGAGADAVYLTSNKALAKKIMRAFGIPTPNWLDLTSLIRSNRGMDVERVILKRICDDASVDITDECVRAGTRKDILEGFDQIHGDQHVFFVEEYIEGREINVAIVESDDGKPTILPPTEILFKNFPPEKPEIVNYSAKWHVDSFEYTHTPRTFSFSAGDRPMLEAVTRHARTCWECFGLRGYARVDFRIDFFGNPWVLEVNANPCISPDGGFYAAFQRAGLGGYHELTEMLLAGARRAQRELAI